MACIIISYYKSNYTIELIMFNKINTNSLWVFKSVLVLVFFFNFAVHILYFEFNHLLWFLNIKQL